MRSISPVSRSLLGAAMVASFASVGNAAVSITVHDNTVIHTVRADYTGTNFESFWNPNGARAGVINDMKASKFGMIRFPGGIPCDFFDYQNPGSGNWGILDAKAVALAGGSKLMYQTNVYDAAATKGQNTAATVQAIDAYLKANAVPLAMYEIGNEPEYGPQKTDPIDTYMAVYNTVFTTQYNALKAVSPNVPIIGPGTSSLAVLAKFLAAHGNKSGDGKATDGVSFHFYAGGGYTNYDYQRNYAQTGMAALIASINSTIATYDTRPLPIYITEWNWINGGGWGSYDYTFTGCFDADMVGEMMNLGVAGNTQFCLSPIIGSGGSGYGMICAWDGYREAKADDVNASFLSLSLAQKLGTSVLQVDNPADPGDSLSAYATKTADGKIQVMVINKDVTMAQDVNISFSSYLPMNKAVEVNTLKNNTGTWGEQQNVLNGVLMPILRTGLAMPAGQSVTAASNTYALTLPAGGSMAVLIFGGGGGTTTSGTTTSGTTTSGTTTSGTTTSGTTGASTTASSTTGTTSTGTTTGSTSGSTSATGTTTGSATTSSTSTATGTTSATSTSATSTTTGTGSTSTSGSSTSTTSATTTSGSTTVTPPADSTQTEGSTGKTSCGLGSGLAMALASLSLIGRLLLLARSRR